MPAVTIASQLAGDALSSAIDIVTDLAIAVGDVLGPPFATLLDVVGDVADFFRGPLATAVDVLGRAFHDAAAFVQVFVDAIGAAVGLAHDLARALDPNMAALEDVRDRFRDMGVAAGLSSDQIEDAMSRAEAAASQGALQTEADVRSYLDSYKAASDSADGWAQTVADTQDIAGAKLLAGAARATAWGQSIEWANDRANLSARTLTDAASIATRATTDVLERWQYVGDSIAADMPAIHSAIRQGVIDAAADAGGRGAGAFSGAGPSDSAGHRAGRARRVDGHRRRGRPAAGAAEKRTLAS